MASQYRRTKNDFDSRIKDLERKIYSLLREAKLNDEPARIDPEKGIDFYDQVARHESNLIEYALELTGGRQVQAARLLNLKESTLSWKIKKLEIRSNKVWGMEKT